MRLPCCRRPAALSAVARPAAFPAVAPGITRRLGATGAVGTGTPLTPTISRGARELPGRRRPGNSLASVLGDILALASPATSTITRAGRVWVPSEKPPGRLAVVGGA